MLTDLALILSTLWWRMPPPNLTMTAGGISGNEMASLSLVIIFETLKGLQKETDLLIKLYNLPLITRISSKCCQLANGSPVFSI